MQRPAEVEGQANRLANSLAARGVAKATRIAVLSADSFEYVLLLTACLKLGATFVPVDPGLTEDAFGRLMHRADADFLFVCERSVPLGRRLVQWLPAPPQLLSLDGSLGDDLADLIAQGSTDPVGICVADDDVLISCFTSNSSQIPFGDEPCPLVSAVAAHLVEHRTAPDEVLYTASPVSRDLVLDQLLTDAAIGHEAGAATPSHRQERTDD